MKYIKLYEEFKYLDNDLDEIETQEKPEISDKTIDDVLKDDFFDDVDDSEEEFDNDKVVNIKGWEVY